MTRDRCRYGVALLMGAAMMTLQAADESAGGANPRDLTGFYTSAKATGVPDVLGPDGVTFVPSKAVPFANEDQSARMNCIPNTAFGYNPYGEQLVQTSGRLTWVNQYNHIVRRIDIDQPRPRKLLPTYSGYSAGHWEGDVLVVETTQLRKIEARGAPVWASVQRVSERIRKIDGGRGLERITSFFATTPQGGPSTLTTRSLYTLQPEQHLYEYLCEDGAGRFGDAEK